MMSITGLLVSTLVSFKAHVFAEPFFKAQQAEAVGVLPFGGFSDFVIYCTCSGGILHYIYDARGYVSPLVYEAAETYSQYQVYRPGVSMIGQYTPGGVCLVTATPTCTSIAATGFMTMVGTSY